MLRITMFPLQCRQQAKNTSSLEMTFHEIKQNKNKNI